MSRRVKKVLELAAEAEVDVESAVLALLDAGLNVTSPAQTVWFRDLPLARSALGLSSSPARRDALLVEDLAQRAGLPESEARNRLAKAQILPKKRLKRVPAHLLGKAEQALGIQGTPTAVTLAKQVERHGEATAAVTLKEGPPRRKPKPAWPTIGPAQDIIFLTPGDVVDLHWVLVKDFARSKDPIDPPGVRSEALLDSAVHRPKTALGATDKYPSVAMAAAALLHALVLDHPFHNGNKRTALVSMLTFLDRNGWVLTCDQDEIYDVLLRLADHKLTDRDGRMMSEADDEVLHIAGWLQAKMRKVALREHLLQFRHLRAILETYECVLDHARSAGNRINIRRGRLQTQVFYRNEGEDVQKNTIHKIRRDLELDGAHGYDSDIFYNRGPRIPEFINKYRGLLDRLAKV